VRTGVDNREGIVTAPQCLVVVTAGSMMSVGEWVWGRRLPRACLYGAWTRRGVPLSCKPVLFKPDFPWSCARRQGALELLLNNRRWIRVVVLVQARRWPSTWLEEHSSSLSGAGNVVVRTDNRRSREKNRL